MLGLFYAELFIISIMIDFIGSSTPWIKFSMIGLQFVSYIPNFYNAALYLLFLMGYPEKFNKRCNWSILESL